MNENIQEMKQLTLKLGVSALLIFFALAVKAQIGDNRVIITRGFEPTLNDANKINQSPKMDDTVYAVPKFNYSIEESKLPTPFKIEPLSPAKLVGEPLQKLFGNYVIGGMGTQVSPYFEYYHNNTRSKNMAYGAHIKHFSAAGQIKDYAFPGFSNNLAEVNGSYLFKHSKISSNAGFQRDVVHFYGFKPAEVDSGISIPTDKENAQTFILFNFDTRFKSLESEKSKHEYNLGLNYRYFNTKFDNTEHKLVFDFESLWTTKLFSILDDQKFGFEGDIKLFSNKWSYNETQNNYLISFVPQYRFKYSALEALIGVNAEIFKDSAALIEFSPKLEFKVSAIEKILYFNLGINGGLVRNSLCDLSYENPFVGDSLDLGYSANKLNLNIGLSTSISKAINFNFQLYYEKWEHAPFYVSDFTLPLRNKFTLVYDDYELLKLSADFAYQQSERLKIMLAANYYSYNMTEELYAWHKPDFDIRLFANYNIQNKFVVRAEIFAYGKSMAADTAAGEFIGQTIKPWFDANLGLEYRYSKKLAFFVNCNNIAATKYYRFYYYPAYRFNLLAGFSFVF